MPAAKRAVKARAKKSTTKAINKTSKIRPTLFRFVYYY